MKLFSMAALAAVALTGIAPAGLATAASAQDRVVVRERTVVRHHEDRGWHNGWKNRRVCRWQYRHHERVRICRTVRWH